MLWRNFAANLFGMHAVILRSYRPLFSIYIVFGQGKFHMGVHTSDNALHEKVVWQANGRRLSAEIFDGENVDKLIKIRQIHQYFPPSKFCTIRYNNINTWYITVGHSQLIYTLVIIATSAIII